MFFIFIWFLYMIGAYLFFTFQEMKRMFRRWIGRRRNQGQGQGEEEQERHLAAAANEANSSSSSEAGEEPSAPPAESSGEDSDNFELQPQPGPSFQIYEDPVSPRAGPSYSCPSAASLRPGLRERPVHVRTRIFLFDCRIPFSAWRPGIQSLLPGPNPIFEAKSRNLVSLLGLQPLIGEG